MKKEYKVSYKYLDPNHNLSFQILQNYIVIEYV